MGDRVESTRTFGLRGFIDFLRGETLREWYFGLEVSLMVAWEWGFVVNGYGMDVNIGSPLSQGFSL